MEIEVQEALTLMRIRRCVDLNVGFFCMAIALIVLGVMILRTSSLKSVHVSVSM